MTTETETSAETKALAEFDVTEAALAEIKQYEKLEIQDKKSEANVRKCRQVVRSMRTGVDKRRKELKAPILAKGKLIDKTAKELTARLLPTEQNLDEKIKVVENAAEIEKAAKLEADKIRKDAIKEKLAGINDIATDAQKYGLGSKVVWAHLRALEETVVAEDVFDEFVEAGEDCKQRGVEVVGAALERTVQFEKDQAAQKELEAANKLEAERIVEAAKEAEEAAKKQREVQEKADAEAKAKRDAEAAILVKEREKFEAEKVRAAEEAQAKVDAENARIAEENRKIQAEKDRIAAEEERKAQEEADRLEDIRVEKERKAKAEADRLEIIRAESEAYEDNAEFDRARAETAAAEAARQEALRPDVEKLREFAVKVSELKLPEMSTEDGARLSTVFDSMLRNFVEVVFEETEEL